MTPNYTSYMLRIQLKKSGNHSVWVASLQSTKTGELRWFPTIEVLIRFLQDEFCGQNEADNLSFSEGPETKITLPEK